MPHRTFIGIGAQKAGTTTLADYLSAHPQVYVPAIKEMHFFDFLGDDAARLPARIADDLRRRHLWISNLVRSDGSLKNAETFDQKVREIQSITERHEIGTDAQRYRDMLMSRPEGTVIAGEITPAYALLDHKKMAMIPKVLDRPHILFILRNPVDRFLSQVSHQSSKLARKQTTENNLLALLDRKGMAGRSRYDHTLRVVRDVFPKEDVFIGFFEEMVGPEAPAFHEKICAFLEIDTVLAPRVVAGPRVVARSCDIDTRAKIVRALAPVYTAVANHLGTVPELWQADMELL